MHECIANSEHTVTVCRCVSYLSYSVSQPNAIHFHIMHRDVIQSEKKNIWSFPISLRFKSKLIQYKSSITIVELYEQNQNHLESRRWWQRQEIFPNQKQKYERNRIFIERNQNLDEIVPMFVANKSNLHNKDLHRIKTSGGKRVWVREGKKTSGFAICHDATIFVTIAAKREKESAGEGKREKTDLNPILTWTARKVFALYMQMQLMRKDHKKYYSLSRALKVCGERKEEKCALLFST